MTNHTTEMPRLSWAEVVARRLDRHGLFAPLPAVALAGIVSTICGAHAQVLSAAELSIGLRIDGITRTDVRNALWTEHSLIKSFGPRGTVHLLAAQDLPMWTGALSAIPTLPRGFPKHAQLTSEQTDEIVEAIGFALEDAELTIDELSEAVIARTGAWAGELVMPAFQSMWPRWRQVMDTAANRGALCFGPNRGRNITYTNPRRWLPGFRPADGKSALADLVKRYLVAYGPATPQQFAQWLNAPRRWAAELFDSLTMVPPFSALDGGEKSRAELQQVELEGSLAWQVAGDTTIAATLPQGVRLLPYFDAYVVGCHPRERLFPGKAAQRALAGGQAGNFPVLLVDGIVAGVWHLHRSGRKLEITVEPFGSLTPTQRRELDDLVGRIGEILEGTPQLTIGSVTAGAHA